MTKVLFGEVFPDTQIVATMSHPLNKTPPMMWTPSTVIFFAVNYAPSLRRL